MKKLIVLGLAGVAGAIAFRCVPRERRDRLTSAVKDRMNKRLERIMAKLPDDFPPKLIMTVLPQLKAQQDEIITLLREQNKLLRKSERTSSATTAA